MSCLNPSRVDARVRKPSAPTFRSAVAAPELCRSADPWSPVRGLPWSTSESSFRKKSCSVNRSSTILKHISRPRNSFLFNFLKNNGSEGLKGYKLPSPYRDSISTLPCLLSKLTELLPRSSANKSLISSSTGRLAGSSREDIGYRCLSVDEDSPPPESKRQLAVTPNPAPNSTKAINSPRHSLILLNMSPSLFMPNRHIDTFIKTIKTV